MSNPAGLVSFNKIKEHLRLGSVNTVTNYIEYLEDSWLLFTTRIYDYSVKRQQVSPKKIYGVDTGLVNAIGFHFPPNPGKLLENMIFLELRRQTNEIFYLTTQNGFEIDFYLPETCTLIQVTQNMSNTTTREREIRAIQDAIQTVDTQHILILAEDTEDLIRIGDKEIQIQSIPEWLLQQPG